MKRLSAKMKTKIIPVLAIVIVTGCLFACVPRDKIGSMKVNFVAKSYATPDFAGEEVVPHYTKEYFNVASDSLATLNREDAGGGVRLSFCAGATAYWGWVSNNGLELAECCVSSSLDLRGKASAGVTIRDVISGGVLVVKTPTKTHQIYLGEKSRGVNFEGGLLTFTEAGQYQIKFLFSTWYRYNTSATMGKTENQYHVLSYDFEIAAGETANAIDKTVLEVDEVLRFDHRTVAAEIQKRNDDFYYWTDCVIHGMVLFYITPTGNRFFNVRFSYKGGAIITEQVREDLTPNYPLAPA